ncbi:hypothetical protein AGLY_017340 [Aphis glycines]|uniref:Uncharacterized protein n=1 Tax=Aphis glycines TaxID=307491 RepID=A0A6G0SX81_APHGL|nr:hypothetical protein AGLY_017340 [Aphis glycines]
MTYMIRSIIQQNNRSYCNKKKCYKRLNFNFLQNMSKSRKFGGNFVVENQNSYNFLLKNSTLSFPLNSYREISKRQNRKQFYENLNFKFLRNRVPNDLFSKDLHISDDKSSPFRIVFHLTNNIYSTHVDTSTMNNVRFIEHIHDKHSLLPTGQQLTAMELLLVDVIDDCFSDGKRKTKHEDGISEQLVLRN